MEGAQEQLRMPDGTRVAVLRGGHGSGALRSHEPPRSGHPLAAPAEGADAHMTLKSLHKEREMFSSAR